MARPGNTVIARSSTALPIDYKLGEYAIESVLGHGGFGVTYLAKDTRLGAQVAIKEYFPQAFAVRQAGYNIIPRPGANGADRENYNWGLQQFLKEAQALARFKHNHIVRVLRFLEANGTAYMVMEYERGESLQDYLKKHGGFLAEPMLLKVFLPILSGLQAVHDAGLLHLDIKPDNIYLRENGQPMLIDFGSAQQARSDSDESQKVALTRGYCAIEHYPGKGKQGPWTDVYSIGATLYRCIAGREPVDVLERHNTLKARGFDPLTPAVEFDRPKFSQHIRECVDAAMRITPDRRPHSAAVLQNGLMGKGLVEDLPAAQGVYGSGFIGVIKTAAAETRKRVFVRRGLIEKLIVFLVFVATLAVVIPKIMIDTGQMTEDELYQLVDESKLRVQTAAIAARRYVDENVFGRAPRPEVASAPGPRPPARRKPDPQEAIPPFSVERTAVLELKGHTGAVVSLSFLRDGDVLVSVSDDGMVKLWRTEGGKPLRDLPMRTSNTRAVAASPDGALLAMPSDDHGIVLWDIEAQKEAGRLPGHSAIVDAIAFSPDGKHLVSAGQDKIVALWDLAEKKRVQNLRENKSNVLALAFAPNGRLLVAGDTDGGIQFWETASMKELAYSVADTDRVTALAFAPDGKWLVSGGTRHHLKLWKIGVDRGDRPLAGAPETVHALAFSPDNKWLLLAGTTEALQIWDLETGEVARRLLAHNHDIYAIAATRDGVLLATGGDDRMIRLWR